MHTVDLVITDDPAEDLTAFDRITILITRERLEVFCRSMASRGYPVAVLTDNRYGRDPKKNFTAHVPWIMDAAAGKIGPSMPLRART